MSLFASRHTLAAPEIVKACIEGIQRLAWTGLSRRGSGFGAFGCFDGGGMIDYKTCT